MSSNAAVATKFSDILSDLGNIPAQRVRTEPAPGTATADDLLRVNNQGAMCELVDGVLVEKAITKYELVDETQTLSGGDILPGLVIPLNELFRELDRTRPQ